MARELYSFILLYFFTFSFSQNVDIPDINLKNALLEITSESQNAKDLNGNYTKLDLNGDGEIQISEAQNISFLKALTTSVKPFNNIIGLDSFSNLTYLMISNFNFHNVNLYGNTKLIELKLFTFFNFETLDISNCKNLEILDVSKINSIDVSKNTNLKNLTCIGSFPSIDLSKNLLLSNLTLSSKNLKNINLSQSGNLKFLTLDEDDLQQLNLEFCSNLQSVRFTSTKLTGINLEKNNKLNSIYINEANNLTELFLPKDNSVLKDLNIYRTSLKNVNLSTSHNLNSIYFQYNKFENIDFSSNSNLLQALIFYEDNITSLNFNSNINLEQLNVMSLPSLSSIYLKNGKKQYFGEAFGNCPKLNSVCCDEDEKDFFINKGIPDVTTDCLLATQENSLVSKVKIYPNPASDYLYFNQKIDSVKVFDIQGKFVLNRKINSNNLNVSELKNGVYVLEFFSENKKSSQKFIKK